MTFADWVLGVLFRPAATFEYARQNLRFGYWWILLSVLTIETVTAIYSPPLPGGPSLSVEDTVFTMFIWLLLLFAVQALLLMVAARVFGWQLPWMEALKYTGLLWSIVLVEDLFAFYPALTGNHRVTAMIALPFIAWYVWALAMGIKRLTGLSTPRALVTSAMATLPFRLGLLWLYWSDVTTAATTM